MANNTLKVRHKQRYDTEENWKSKNPVLLAGEMAISSDKNGRFKVGDGNNKWSALAYAKADLSKSDVTTALGYTPPTKNTTYSTGTASTAGIGKLYTTTGTATDGSMTQSAITTALNGKSPTSHTHNCIVQMGNDSITTKTQDTVENWAKTNNSVHFFTALDELVDQPSQYGLVFNISNGAAEVHQLWMTQSSGNMAHRGGNKNGWDGTWRTILDSSNYSTYALPASKVVASKYSQTDLTTLAGSDWSMIPTLNTLAYWNGRFNSRGSSLAYCKLGAFGSGATKNISYGTAAPSGTANVGDVYIQIS